MELINLGLPSNTRWASCNIGASNLTEYGDYFAWGDVSTKKVYIGRTCKTYDIDFFTLKYEDCLNRNNVLAREFDAASYNIGKDWTLPSGEQAQELIDSCKWEWKEDYKGQRINGQLGISKINGAEIFLPAAGRILNSDYGLVGQCGGYWTGAPNVRSSNRAWSIAFDKDGIGVYDHNFRYYGFSIRPLSRL